MKYPNFRVTFHDESAHIRKVYNYRLRNERCKTGRDHECGPPLLPIRLKHLNLYALFIKNNTGGIIVRYTACFKNPVINTLTNAAFDGLDISKFKCDDTNLKKKKIVMELKF